MEYKDLQDEILLNIFSSLSSQFIPNISLTSRSFYRHINEDIIWKLIINKQISSREKLPEDIASWKAFYQMVFFNLKQLENKNYNQRIVSFKTFVSELDKIVLDDELTTKYLSIATIYDADIWANRLIKAGALVDQDIIKSAIKNNAIFCIQEFLKRNLINFNAELGKGEAPTYLHYAAYYARDKRIVARLFDHSITTSKTAALPRLHLAAATGNLDLLKDIILRTKDIDERDAGICTALWWALICGKVECARLLITAGASLDYISTDIIYAGIDSSLTNLNTALTAAIWSRNIDCFALVLSYQPFDVNPQLFREEVQTPISLLFKADFVEGLEYVAAELDAITLKKGDYSLLHAAIDHKSLKILSYLLEKRKGEINHLFVSDTIDEKRDRYIQTHSPLIHALFYGYLKTVKLLLQAGADPTQLGRFICYDRSNPYEPCSDHFLIPLKELFKNKKHLLNVLGIEEAVNVTRLLLDKISLKLKSADRTLHILYTKNYLQNEALFDWLGASNDYKSNAFHTLSLKILELLIEYGADIYYVDANENTALSLAEGTNNKSFKRLLLKADESKRNTISQSNNRATFFSKPANIESIFIHHYGIGRIDLDIDPKLKELYITGLGSFLGIVVIGERKISLIHWDAEAKIEPVLDEIKYIGDNTKLIVVRDLSRASNDKSFGNFIKKLHHPNYEVIELYDKKFGGTITVKSDKTFNTYPKKVTKEQMTIRAMAAFINQFVINFQNNKADLLYDGKQYTPTPALNDSSYRILSPFFKIDLESTPDEKFKAMIKVIVSDFCERYGWPQAPNYINEYFYHYLTHKYKQLKLLENCVNEGNQLFKEGKLAAAKMKFTLACKIVEVYCKQDNPFHAMALFNLATLFFKENDFSQALKYYQDCLTIRKALFKADDPKLKAVINAITQTENKLKEQQPTTISFGKG